MEGPVAASTAPELEVAKLREEVGDDIATPEVQTCVVLCSIPRYFVSLVLEIDLYNV